MIESGARTAATWLQKADADLECARHDLEGGFYDQACFNCQQSVEKALKAFLLSRGHGLIRTHSLPQLLARSMEEDPTFAALQEACAVLTVYYVDTRYPDAVEASFGEEAAAEAVDLARQTLRSIRTRIGAT